MNKLLIVLLFPFAGFGQTLKDTTEAMLPLTVTPKSAQQRYDRLSLPAATSTQDGHATKEQVTLLINTAAKAGSTEAAVTTLTADLKRATDRIAALEALAPGLPVPVEVTGSTYVITPNDNNKTIFVYTNATITLNIQGAGFKCKVVRMGNGRPRFVTSGITMRMRSNFTPLSVQYQAVELEWKEGEVVIQ